VPAEQPVIFDGAVILDERWPWSPDGYATEPHPSSTWQLSYDAFKRGEILALPHYATRPTDPGKHAQLTAAYASWRAGGLPTGELPDLANIFSDDPQTRAELGFQTEPDAAAPDLLIQACAQCHSDVLDQTLSRARFNVALGRLEPSELAVAVRRLELPRGNTAAMPPRGRRQLDEAARAKLIAYLKSSRPSEDDERLERVAQLGMAQKQPKSAEQLSRH
jgi:mono/diheme cytochrome c family protein